MVLRVLECRLERQNEMPLGQLLSVLKVEALRNLCMSLLDPKKTIREEREH
jgi:hypothetical protein